MVYIHAHVDMWRGETAHGRVSRKTDYRGHGHLRFLSFSLNLLNPGKNRTLERAQSPPAYPFFHIAEYKLCPGCADLDRAPLRIRARLNLRIKLARVFSDSKFGFGRTKLVRSRSKVLFPRVPA